MEVGKMKNLKTENQINRNQEIKRVKEKEMMNPDEFLIKDEGSQLKRHIPRVNPVKKRDDFYRLPKPTNIPNAQEIKKQLDLSAIGRDEAKIALSTAVFENYANIYDAKIPKENTLLIGELGSGKTLLVETIAKIINVPFVSIDSSTISQPGFKGSNPNTVLNQLFQKSGQSKERAENGIVFFGEIDKLSTYGTAEVIHDHRIAVQQSLLKMIEGSELPISDDNSATILDTGKILNSPINGIKKFYEEYGVKLDFTEVAKKKNAQEAFSLAIGVRGINSVLKSLME